MRLYNYYTYETTDAYGQAQASIDYKGKIKMAINITSQGIQDNINYKDCNYIGLTLDSSIDDTYIIEYGDLKLKVLYINPKGRYTQVFLGEI